MIDAPTVVLVVEDEALLRLLLMDVLEEAGFEVIEACTADDAVLLLAHRSDIRLVFTDVDMPGLWTASSSRNTCRTTTATWPSSSVLESAALARRNHPGTVFLQKPYSTSALVNHVRRMTVREQDGVSSPPLPSPASRL